MILALLTLSFTPYFAPPQSPAPAGPPRVAKVLQIGIDGVRPDALLAAKTPNIDLLIERGVFTAEARTTSITSSGPAWTSILTGARMSLHNVTDNSFKGSRVAVWDTWLGQLETRRPDSFTAAVSQWGPIHEQLTTGCVDFSAGVGTAAEVTASAKELFASQEHDVTALFLHYDDVDHAGHAFGYSVEVPEYIAAIEAVDLEIGLLLDALKARENSAHEDWLILIGTDHGGKNKGHGEDIPACRTVFMLASADNMPTFSWRPAPEVIDFSSLALNHLGLNGPTVVQTRQQEWWEQRHEMLNHRAAEGTAKVAFFGDSITHGWENAGKEIWKDVYAPLGAANFGISGDCTEHVLWRMRHGNLKNMRPDVCVVMIGTNNAHRDTPEEIAKGVESVVAELLFTLPETEVLLLAIFPRGPDTEDLLRIVNRKVNEQLSPWAASRDQVHFLNLNPLFLTEEGTLSANIMPDLLHPNAEGYRIWAEGMESALAELLED